MIGLLLQPFQVIHSRSAVAGVKCWTTLLTVISSDDEVRRACINLLLVKFLELATKCKIRSSALSVFKYSDLRSVIGF